MSKTYDLATDMIRHLYDSRLSDPPVLDMAERFPEAERFVAALAACSRAVTTCSLTSAAALKVSPARPRSSLPTMPSTAWEASARPAPRWKYAWRHAEDYNALLFVTAQSPADLRSKLADLGDLLGLVPSVIKVFVIAVKENRSWWFCVD